jgi:hypothetical protein
MTAGLEAASAEEFIFDTLTGDTTLTGLIGGRVFNTQAVQGAAYPLVVYQWMSGQDYAAVGAERIWTNLLYLVKAIADNALYPDAIAARIDALLHRASGNVTNGVVWSCTREQVIRLPDAVAGSQFRQSGAVYRLLAA